MNEAADDTSKSIHYSPATVLPCCHSVKTPVKELTGALSLYNKNQYNNKYLYLQLEETTNNDHQLPLTTLEIANV